jgi:hypothetical protein
MIRFKEFSSILENDDKHINSVKAKLGMNSGRTNAYVGTFNHHDPDHQEQIKTIKKHVTAHNKEHGTTMYVKLQGRLGKDNPNAIKYGGAPGSEERKNAKRKNHQVIHLGDAGHADAYIYHRR